MNLPPNHLGLRQTIRFVWLPKSNLSTDTGGGEGSHTAFDAGPVLENESDNIVTQTYRNLNSAADELRGFHAIEFLLFGDGVSDNDKTAAELTPAEMNYLIALTEAFKDRTQALEDSWTVDFNNLGPYAEVGEGLADNRTDFDANGKEWKTRPLWGIGLTHTVNPLAGFLHDGRAKTLQEAILWHGGEAEDAKERFRTMIKADRDALVAFLNSL